MGQLTVLPGGTSRAPDADDADLIERARRGDDDAFAELYRRHFPAALRTALSYVRPAHLAEDVVSDVFDGVWGALRSGKGPTEHFQPYLVTAIRNRAIRLSTRPNASEPLAEHHPSLTTPGPEPPAEEGFAKRAFDLLPRREREVLWLTAIEGQSPAEAARVLSLSERAAASLRFRAKRTFAELYLAERGAAAATTTVCRDLSPKLSRYVRGTCPPLTRRNVERHLSACPSCQDVIGELQSVNATLRSALLPGIALVSSPIDSTARGFAARVGAGTLRVLSSKPILAAAAVGVVAMIPASTLFGGTPPPGPENTQIEESERRPAPVVRPPRWDDRIDQSLPGVVDVSVGPKRLASSPVALRPAAEQPSGAGDDDSIASSPTTPNSGSHPSEPMVTEPATLPPIVTTPPPIPTTPHVTSPPIPETPTTPPVLSVGVSVESPVVDADVGVSAGDTGVAIDVDASIPIVDLPSIEITLLPITIPGLLGG